MQVSVESRVPYISVTLCPIVPGCSSDTQAVQADLKSAAYKHEQWQLATDAVLASLQLDVEQLKRSCTDMQAGMRQVVEQLKSSVGLQMEAHRQETQEQLQVSHTPLLQMRQKTASDK